VTNDCVNAILPTDQGHLKAYIESVEVPLHGVLVYTFRTSAVVSGKDESRVGVGRLGVMRTHRNHMPGL
jgi:hypothetical protein